jgi:hypothetical protein
VGWRAWCFVCGLAPGALAAFAFAPPDASLPASLGAGAAAGGLVLLGLASLLARRGADGRSLAAGAGAGLAAAPALGAAWLGLAPGARPLAWAALALVVVALAVAARESHGRARPVRAAALGLLGGAVAVVAGAGALARLGAVEPTFGEAAAVGIYDLDARVATLPLPRCGPRPAAVEVLLGRGAHPRLARDGASLWFDAPGGDGRRQVHRMLVATGEVACFTCGEPGENRRPDPNPTGTSVVFDSDRHRGPRAPANTELHLLDARGEPGSRASRQVSFSPGRDDHALFAPDGRSLLWSRGSGGRYDVVSAGFLTGHGGLLLAPPRVVAAGRAAWAAPLAWSADARALVVGRGGPRRPLSAEQLDPATAELRALGDVVDAAFSADGGRVALARAPGAPAPGARAWLGFLLGSLAEARGEPPARLAGGTALETGDTSGELAALELGDVATWGVPTGVALSPDGRWLVLGQRRAAAAGGAEDRLVKLTPDCDG